MPGQLVRTKSATITTVVPTLAGAYAAGDVVGGPVAILRASQDAQTGVILDVFLIDLANQQLACDVFFFQGPLAGAYADNTPFAPTAADLALCCGFVHIAITDYSGAAASAVASPACKPL